MTLTEHVSSSSKIYDWGTEDPMKIGDIFTINGRYKRRSFFQWIFNEPRELQKFILTGMCTGEKFNG